MCCVGDVRPGTGGRGDGETDKAAAAFPLHRIPAEVADIAKRLREAGYEAWYVGGAVRDALLEARGARRRTGGDFDIATSARPEQVRSLFRRTVPVGTEHGTVAVLDSRGRPHEVTTFRKDVTTDGRHAVVAFGVTLADDLARRDFTINAIAVHPESGDIADPFGGRADLAAGSVRAVGEAAERFREDWLRVLRALRFAAVLDFTIEPATWSAVTDSADALEYLSRERVRDEWLKTLAGAAPSVAFGWWRRAGALAAVWPELAHLSDSSDAALDALVPADAVLITAAAMAAAQVPAGAAEAAVSRLRFSNRDAARVRAVVAGLAAPLPAPGDERALRRWLAEHLLFAGDVLRAAGPRAAARLSAAEEMMRRGVALSLADLAVTGDDLMTAGVPKGPEIGATLRRLLTAVLDDPAVNTRERLLALAKQP